MKGKNKKLVFILLSIILLTNTMIVQAQTSQKIIFNDNNLKNALSKFYDWTGIFTRDKASELSEDGGIKLDNSNISDLEGLQYFDKLGTIYLGKNNLFNLKPLAEMNWLVALDLSNNQIKGKEFESMLNTMGRIKNLYAITLNNDEISDINFLEKMGNINKIDEVVMRNNKISDITMLKNATKLYCLDFQNNRITDVTPLKDLKKLTYYIDLRDNCIIDYSPIRHLFDKMYEDFDSDNGMDRYDYYTNPVNFKYDGKKITFPYLTVYYKYQAYAEAIPLFEALGGSAEYDKETGTLTCQYDGNVLVMKDFTKKYTLNGEEKSLKYEMRRMQYDLAYVPVKDICNVLGLNYNVIKKRGFYQNTGEYKYAPKLVEISKKG